MTINGVEIQEGWLKISKQFNAKYLKDESLGVDSSLDISVMLDVTLDDNLRQKGMAREIINKVQKLRKSAGLNIDDHVEIFYEVPSDDASTLSNVVKDNLEAIRSSLRTAFLSSEEHKQAHFVKIAETEYVNPENEKDVIKLVICAPNVSFNKDKLNVSLPLFLKPTDIRLNTDTLTQTRSTSLMTSRASFSLTTLRPSRRKLKQVLASYASDSTIKTLSSLSEKTSSTTLKTSLTSQLDDLPNFIFTPALLINRSLLTTLSLSSM